jgi:site-specific recombinase XerD
MSAPLLTSPALAPVVQRFFAERLIQQRHVTAATVAAYRDTFRLLLRFAEGHLKHAPALMRLEDLDAPLVLAFLDHLEQARGNTIRSRNARLAAVRSFVRYASTEEPACLPTAQRVLVIPTKRCAKPMLGFLARDEMQAILDAPSPNTHAGQRDRALFLTLYNTGARISEALGLTIGDVLLDGTPRVVLRGKGRKERTVPLWARTARVLAAWIRTHGGGPTDRLFPNGRRGALTRSGASQRLAIAVARAADTCASLRGRRISPHVVRHTTAMHLLQSGTDTAVIALWLGHESPTTTHGYLEADLAMKERALARVPAPALTAGRFKASDDLLAFLDRL